jgi:hypothetical protein
MFLARRPRSQSRGPYDLFGRGEAFFLARGSGGPAKAREGEIHFCAELYGMYSNQFEKGSEFDILKFEESSFVQARIIPHSTSGRAIEGSSIGRDITQ